MEGGTIKIYIIVFAIALFFSNNVISQQVIIEKEIVENATNCQQFDVTLSITGKPPVQPQEVILLIDNSGSMNDQVTVNGVTKTLLTFAQEAAIDFVNSLFTASNDPDGKNKVAIVSYNSFSNIEIGLTNSSGKQDIINEINSITAGGSTNMEDSLIKARSIFASQGTFDCTTSRNIVLLTDGVARWHNGLGTNVTFAGQCDDETIDTDCQTRAFSAATDAETITVGGELYQQQIFTVGFTGSLNANQLAVSEHTLNSIQNSGAFYTEDAADLTGIYDIILGRLLAAATSLDGESLVKDIVSEDFQIEENSLMSTKGTFTITGQRIDWYVDRIIDETVTLSYSIVAKADECGISDPGISSIEFQDTNCNIVSEIFSNPQVCVPCPEALVSVSKVGCRSVDFSSSVNQVSCIPTSENYFWKFYLNGQEIDASDISGGIPTTDSGTFVYIGSGNFSGTFTAELEYQGFYESNCPATMVNDTATVAVDCSSDLSLRIAVNDAIPKVGDTITYNLTIRNDGPEEASDIEVNNVLPAGLIYDEVGSIIPSGTTFNDNTGVWDLNNIAIPNGDTIQLSLNVRIVAAGTFDNRAEITRAINEGDLDSNPNNGL